MRIDQARQQRSRWGRWGPLAPALLAAMLAGAGVAHAQTSPAPGAPGEAAGTQESIALFEEGRRLVEAGDCAAAIPKLMDSLRYHASIGALLNLGDCSAPTSAAAAWRYYTRAELLAARNADDRAAFARGKAAALEPRVALVHVALPAGLDVPELRIDGARIAPSDFEGHAIAVEPGKHVLEVDVKGARSSQPFEASPGVATTVTPDLQQGDLLGGPPEAARDKQAQAQPQPVADAETGSGRRTAGLVLAGAGIVGIGVGAIAGLVANAKLNDAKNSCTAYPRCPASSETSIGDANASAKSAATVSTIGFIAGAAALAGGVTLWLTARRGAGVHARLAPVVGQTNGCVLRGEF